MPVPTLDEIEEELSRRKQLREKPVETDSLCPLAEVEKCGRHDCSAGIACITCESTRRFLGRYLAVQDTEKVPQLSTLIKEQVSGLKENQETELGNLLTDEFVLKLLITFLDTASDVLRSSKEFCEIGEDDLHFLHVLALLKDSLDDFNQTQAPAIDRALVAFIS